MNDKWNDALLYEQYMGKWSRLAAVEFLTWLNAGEGKTWVDIGCGTGALSEIILAAHQPERLHCLEPSESFIALASKTINDSRAEFHTANAENTTLTDASADVVVSALALNFFPDIPAALREFKRIAKPGGLAGVYVWDYSARMEMIRYFWDAAALLFDNAKDKDEGVRFPICNPEMLRDAFVNAGFRNVEVKLIDIPTRFRDFDDYWTPFLSGVGPAPGYCMSLSESDRNKLKGELHTRLPVNEDGSIDLIARAIGAKVSK